MDDNEGLTPETVEGMERASESAERSSPEWSLRAALALVAFIEKYPDHTFIAPTVRKWAEKNGLSAPPSNMAWGGIFASASRAGIIEAAGYTRYADKTMHTQSVQKWRSACKS